MEAEQAKNPSSFRFNAATYRLGSPIEEHSLVVANERVRNEHKFTPPFIFVNVESLFTTGRASSAGEILGLLKFEMPGVQLSEEVITFHISQNRERLLKERDEYLSDMHEGLKALRTQLSFHPTVDKYHRINQKMLMLTDAVLERITAGEEDFDVEKLRDLARLTKDLQDIDPLFGKGTLVSGAPGMPNGKGKGQLKTVLAADSERLEKAKDEVVGYVEAKEEIADEMLKDGMEARTAEILTAQEDKEWSATE